MKKLILMLLFGSVNLHAQDDQFQKQIEEIMRAREEMLKSLMDDSTGSDMEKRMLDMMKRFSGPGLDDSSMGFGDFGGVAVGEYDWIDTSTHKILKIKVQQVKDRPLDIKIEKGFIKIKGDVVSSVGNGNNKVVRKVNFERSFSLPNDVDQTNPEFENKAGEVLIKFKRLSAIPTKTKMLKKMPPERVPVAPDGDDLSI